MNDSVSVKVKILDREYQLACTGEERGALLDAARYLDGRMREMRSRSHGQITGSDKLAVVAALNIVHEMLALQSVQSSLEQFRGKLSALSHSVDVALAEE